MDGQKDQLKPTDSQDGSFRDEQRSHSSPPRRPARAEVDDYAGPRDRQSPSVAFDGEEEEDLVNPGELSSWQSEREED